MAKNYYCVLCARRLGEEHAYHEGPTCARRVAAEVRILELCASDACVVCKGIGGDVATGPCVDCGGTGKHTEVAS